MMRAPQEKCAILEIVEADLRTDVLLQAEYAVDKGVHIGGALSAITPLTALYFGGSMHYDTTNPTTTKQDVFILSKGHAIAALAAVYAHVGYISRENLKYSRGWGALIKGHPGPVIPGVPIATGPLGHGISVACGYALGRRHSGYDVYCMVGDGELQEGSCWEGIMFAADHALGNLCVLVDKNNGQSDDTRQLVQRCNNIGERFTAFGFTVIEANGRSVASVMDALIEFKQHGSKPTVIICESTKGYGGHAALTGKHKVTFTTGELETEYALQHSARKRALERLNRFGRTAVRNAADELGYTVTTTGEGAIIDVTRIAKSAALLCAAPRSKALSYDKTLLPTIESGKAYGSSDITTGVAKAFATDERFYTIDADLSNVSGLYVGTELTNRSHAINTGIAEANMMCMAEGLAADGANVWVSTFGPFFDWQAFRRIAVSYQEREEAIGAKGGWLSRGHNLDITFLSTAANLDSAVNGATHIAHDDSCFFDQLAHVKIIDVCCPRQQLEVSKWIAEGNRGLVYLRVMRNATLPVYGAGYSFEYGKAYPLTGCPNPVATIISSGHGVQEVLEAGRMLTAQGIPIAVVDMPSYDMGYLCELAKTSAAVLVYEQNNGYIFNKLARDIAMGNVSADQRIATMNTRDKNDRLQFIQSGTYSQILSALSLTAQDICTKIKALLGNEEGVR